MIQITIDEAKQIVRDGGHKERVELIEKLFCEIDTEQKYKVECLHRIESLENLCDNYGVDIDEAEEI